MLESCHALLDQRLQHKSGLANNYSMGSSMTITGTPFIPMAIKMQNQDKSTRFRYSCDFITEESNSSTGGYLLYLMFGSTSREKFLIDEFALADVREANQSWRNKFGYQIGAKYFNAFTIENLLLQLEYNHIRPYVYSHSTPITNYGHNNQSLGHQWGGNAREVVAIARYFKGRWFGDAKRCEDLVGDGL